MSNVLYYNRQNNDRSIIQNITLTLQPIHTITFLHNNPYNITGKKRKGVKQAQVVHWAF